MKINNQPELPSDLTSSSEENCASDCSCHREESILSRRDFFLSTALASSGIVMAGLPALAGPFRKSDFQSQIPHDKKLSAEWLNSLTQRGNPTRHRGAELAKIGMPVGGMCCGQLYLGGDGKLWHWDIFNLPQPSNFSDTGGPNYAKPPQPASPIEQGFALKVTTGGKTETRHLSSRGFAAENIEFQGQYPIATVDYKDSTLPITVTLTAFSPFIPLNVEDSSLPTTFLRYTLKNTGTHSAEIELIGWLENAVCKGSGKTGMGNRRIRIVRNENHTLLYCTAEALPTKNAQIKRDDILFEDFESGYGKWKVEDTAFGKEPATGTLPGQQSVSGFLGKHLVNSFLGADATTGKMPSAPFTLERRFIHFLIGGGNRDAQTCINLVIEGSVVRTATGQNSERLEQAYWDVVDLQGRQAHIEIVDNATDGWGHINIDHIVFSDVPPSAFRDLTAQEDYGSMGLALLGDGKNDWN